MDPINWIAAFLGISGALFLFLVYQIATAVVAAGEYIRKNQLDIGGTLVNVTPAMRRQLEIRAKQGDKLAIQVLSILKAQESGGVPLGSADPGQQQMVEAPPADRQDPMTCPGCKRNAWVAVPVQRLYTDKADPKKMLLAEPYIVRMCRSCGMEMCEELQKGLTDGNEQYKYWYVPFETGMDQINQLLTEQKIFFRDQIALMLDQHFGATKDKEATDLMNKVLAIMGFMDMPSSPGSAAPQEPKQEEKPHVDSPESPLKLVE